MRTPSPFKNGRRFEDRCAVLRFWNRWGPHIDIVGGLTIIGMLAGLFWKGTLFISDTQAYGPEIHAQRQKLELVTARTDRMGGNIELIMRALHVKPMHKTDTERQLEEEQAP